MSSRKFSKEQFPSESTNTSFSLLDVLGLDSAAEAAVDSGFMSEPSSAAISSSSEVVSEDRSLINSEVQACDYDHNLTNSLQKMSLNLSKTETKTEDGDLSADWRIYFTPDEERGNTQLHIAIKEDLFKYTMGIIKLGVHPYYLNLQNDDLNTALHLAVINNQPEVIKSLIIAGADPLKRNNEGNTPLHLACNYGNLRCAMALTVHFSNKEEKWFKLLSVRQNLEQTNYAGEYCLHLAAARNHVDLVRLLIQLGADMEAREHLGGCTALHLALHYGSLETVIFLMTECQPDLSVETYAGYTIHQYTSFVNEKIADELKKIGITPPEVYFESDYESDDDDSMDTEDEFDDPPQEMQRNKSMNRLDSCMDLSQRAFNFEQQQEV